MKPNPYRPRQIMDGDLLIGTVEYDYPGWLAIVEATSATQWFSTIDQAREWVRDVRDQMVHQDAAELRLSLRHQWDYVD